MTGPTTILAAIDLQAGSEIVLGRAIELAGLHCARLVVLHVLEGESLVQAAAVSGLRESELLERLERQTRARLESLSGSGSGALDRGFPLTAVLEIGFGSPYRAVLRTIGERNADLVVIGPGVRRSLGEAILGSTADRVIRMAGIPVLVARGQPQQPYRRVVVAVDFCAPSEAAARQARSLAPRATLQLVHAVDLPRSFETALVRAGTSRAGIERFRSTRLARARTDMAEFAQRLALSGRVSQRVVRGVPEAVLVRMSRDGRAQLLAIGPHSGQSVRKAFLGSVTQRILRHADCDVLVASAR